MGAQSAGTNECLKPPGPAAGLRDPAVLTVRPGTVRPGWLRFVAAAAGPQAQARTRFWKPGPADSYRAQAGTELNPGRNHDNVTKAAGPEPARLPE